MSRYDFDPDDYRAPAPPTKQQPGRKTENAKPENDRGGATGSEQPKPRNGPERAGGSPVSHDLIPPAALDDGTTDGLSAGVTRCAAGLRGEQPGVAHAFPDVGKGWGF
jgi:hypothetical protein